MESYWILFSFSSNRVRFVELYNRFFQKYFLLSPVTILLKNSLTLHCFFSRILSLHCFFSQTLFLLPSYCSSRHNACIIYWKDSVAGRSCTVSLRYCVLCHDSRWNSDYASEPSLGRLLTTGASLGVSQYEKAWRRTNQTS